MSAARAAECAGDRFWSFHDELFRAPRLTDQTFIDTAVATGISESAFRTCFESLTTQSAVEKDVAEAQKLNVSSTPTFFLGKRVENNQIKVIERIAGNRSVAELSAVIDRIGNWPSSEQR
jgi:protein-disulfide isomerase